MIWRLLWDEAGSLSCGWMNLGFCWQRNADFIDSTDDLLLEDGDFLLLETGDKILLE